MVDNSYVSKKGIISNVVFYNDDNGYAIARVEDQTSKYTVVGYIPGIKQGKSYAFEGNWTIHKRYGEQFQVREYKEIEPETADEIEVFLASGVVKGIGPKTAKAIVNKYGDKSLEIIEKTPEKLMAIDGIGDKKFPIINRSYVEHKEFAEIVLHFAQFGITAAIAKKIYDVYGSASIDAISENPYLMIEEISGIGFLTVDEIARKLEVKENNDQRIRSAVIYMLRRFLNGGSTYVPENILIENVIKLIDVTTDEIQDAIISLVFDGKITQLEIDNENVIFLVLYYMTEMAVCSELIRISKADLKVINSDIDSLINNTEKNENMVLSELQRKAVSNSLDSGVFVITGGPGTGKTTIIHAIMDIFTASGFEVAIAAPTGRAAKRITETTGYTASTIHRLLEYSFGPDDEQMYFGRNSENMLEKQAVIIDEASMIDVLLMKALLEAIPSGARLIIVGDDDQLPPVGPGNVLRDILSCKNIPSAFLKDIFRQEDESNIVVGAHNINNGMFPELDNLDSDFFMIEKQGEGKILELILKICLSLKKENGEKYDFYEDIQVLTPIKKGLLGNINMNKELQNVLNPKAKGKAELVNNERIFRVGDRVMQTKNNYQREWFDGADFVEGNGVFNGDMGCITGIDIDDGLVTVLFDGQRKSEYGLTDLGELDHAYSITVHKSQGSEFPVVVMPIFSTPPILATRNVAYTAVTRGREKVILIGDKAKLQRFIENDDQNDRWSALNKLLEKNFDKTF